MTSYLSLIGTLIAAGVALGIAVWNGRRTDRLREQDHQAAIRTRQAELLAKLLELHTTAAADKNLTKHDGEMKAILLTLPGHLATLLRCRLDLRYTMDVPLDPASARRLRPSEDHIAGHKWLIFDRSSSVTNNSLDPTNPRAEWFEAELAYDIAGLRGEDQDAVLAALKQRKLAPQ